MCEIAGATILPRQRPQVSRLLVEQDWDESTNRRDWLATQASPQASFVRISVKLNYQLAVKSPSKVTLPTELRGRTEEVGDDLGGESRRRESEGTYECCVVQSAE